MKTHLVILLAFFFLGNLPERSDTTEKEEITRTLHFPPGGEAHELVVDNISGAIDLVGYDGTDVLVVAHRTSYGTTEEKLRLAKEKITLEFREEPGKLIVFVNTPWRCHDGSVSYRSRDNYGYDADFDFEIKVPAHTNVSLKTVNKGKITVANVQGKFDVENVNGGISMTGMEGAGVVSTVNGAVNVRFQKNPDGECGFHTVNGSVDVEVPEELSADLKLKTFNGEVYSDFDVTGLPHRSAPPEKLGRRTVYRGDEYFSVRAGKGGPELTFATLNGDIHILRTHK
jgi:hypothetical protein